MQTLPSIYRWTRHEYGRLGELGFFQGRRVELIGGQIIAMTPKGPRHAALLELIRQTLERTFPPDRYYVRMEQPLALGPHDEPEPDAAVVEGRPQDYFDAHPAGALLVIEIADTTLAYDRGDKADPYAAAGVADYWIVNLADQVIETYRQPSPEPASKTGIRYTERQRLMPSATVTPLAAPDQSISVADLLP